MTTSTPSTDTGREAAAATLTVELPGGSTHTHRLAADGSTPNPLARAQAVGRRLVRALPEATIAVTGDDAARHLAACTADPYHFLGQRPCTCPKTYRLVRTTQGPDYTPHSFVQGITDPQRDCPRCGYYPGAS